MSREEPCRRRQQRCWGTTVECCWIPGVSAGGCRFAVRTTLQQQATLKGHPAAPHLGTAGEGQVVQHGAKGVCPQAQQRGAAQCTQDQAGRGVQHTMRL